MSQNEIPVGWEEFRLEQLAQKIRSGGTPVSTNEEFYKGEVPFVMIEDVTNCGKYLKDTVKHITTQAIKSCSTWRVPPHSLLYTIYATLGDVCINQVEVTTNQAILNIIPNKKIDLEFFYYWLVWHKQFIYRHTAQTTQNNLNAQIVKNFRLIIPTSVKEQQKIAVILQTTDQAIEKTKDLIDKYKKIKQGLLQDLLTQGLGHKEMKETEIGKIPIEWDVKKLKELLAEPTKNGYSPQSPSTITGKWILTLGALSADGLRPEHIKPAPLNDPRVDESLLRNGDILVSRSNTRELVGLASKYSGNPSNCSYPDLMIRVRANQGIIIDSFLEQWFGHPYSRSYLSNAARGTSGSMVKINRQILSDLLVPVPQSYEQEAIVTRLTLASQTVENARQYRSKLERIKLGLLQDLLTRKIRVAI